MLDSKRICPVCNTPTPPDDFPEGSEMCAHCAGKHSRQLSMMRINRNDTFSNRLQELRKKEPAIPGLADAVLDKFGGVDQYANMLVDDFRAVRGDNLSEDKKELHVVPHGALTKFHSLFSDLFSKRDGMVADANPMADVSEEDLMAMVSEGALQRLEMDPKFRRTLIRKILQAEPQILENMMAEGNTLEVSGSEVPDASA